MVKGVEEVVVGYAGGTSTSPTYEQVLLGSSGHAEVVRVTYDETVISLDDILSVFWTIHDPTTLNRQGHDVGTQYRSCIFYRDEKQKDIIEQSIKETQKLWNDPIVTEVRQFEAFYPAEDYHQNYFAKNPEAGYCQVVINPKLMKLREHSRELLA